MFAFRAKCRAFLKSKFTFSCNMFRTEVDSCNLFLVFVFNLRKSVIHFSFYDLHLNDCVFCFAVVVSMFLNIYEFPILIQISHQFLSHHSDIVAF